MVNVFFLRGFKFFVDLTGFFVSFVSVLIKGFLALVVFCFLLVIVL